ncbi:MAG: hypothetical protein Kow00114_22560 [Kiloniellaceae bacterium]
MPIHRSIRPAALLAFSLALAVSPAVRAQDAAPGKPQEDSPSEMAREGLEQMLRALRLLVESIPQYELPEVLENGDIIIRRKHPKPEGEEPEIDETAT